MSSTQWVSLLNAGQYSQLNSGTAYASSVAATDVSPGANTSGQAFVLKGSALRPGMQLRVYANGIVSNTGTPNLTLGLYWGGVAGTALGTTGVVATATGLSNATWELITMTRVVAVGPSGSVLTIGRTIGPYAGTQMIPATSSSGGSATIDTSADKILTVGATWGTNSASNTLTVFQFLVESVQY